MTFLIDEHKPWLAAMIDESSDSDSTESSQSDIPSYESRLDSELYYLANGRTHQNDNYITQSEVFRRKFTPGIRQVTPQLITSFIKNKITRRDIQLRNSHGDVLESILVFDNNDDRLANDPGATDVILRVKSKSKDEYENITNEVRTDADAVLSLIYQFNPNKNSYDLPHQPIDFQQVYENLQSKNLPERTPEQQKIWDENHHLDHMNIHLMVALYKFYRSAELSKSKDDSNKFSLNALIGCHDIRKIVDSADPKKLRDDSQYPKEDINLRIQRQRQFELENKIVSDGLISLIQSNQTDESPSSDYEVISIVSEANHLIDMTDGEYGTDIFANLSPKQWDIVLDRTDAAYSMYEQLSEAVRVQSLTFFRNLYGEQTDIRFQLVENILLDDSENHKWFNIITSCALVSGMRNQFEDFDRRIDNNSSIIIGELLLSNIFRIFEGEHSLESPKSSLVNIALSAFGIASRRKSLSQDFRTRAFDWCQMFLDHFKTFDLTKITEDDRDMIVKAHDVMMALDNRRAQQYFFDKNFEPLDPTFNPGKQKYLSDNAYYKRVDRAQKIARVSGQKRLSFKRRIDQDNNEWGRQFEAKFSMDKSFRDATLDAETVAGLVREFDTDDGILQRNLAFVHTLRYLYAHRDDIDLQRIKNSKLESTKFIEENLNIPSVLTTAMEKDYYTTEAEGFYSWRANLELTDNGDTSEFFTVLKTKFESLPLEQVELPFDIFLLEADGVEVSEFVFDPVRTRDTLFHYDGKIRSWKGGYHGRLLTVMQAFMDQDEIRKRMQENPNYQLNLEEFEPHYRERLGRERFYNEKNGVRAYLEEAISPTGNPQFNFSAELADIIIDNYINTGFSAYVPQWLLFIIDHRFINNEGKQNYKPLIRAFEALADSKFPEPLMRELFENRGYLKPASDPSVLEEDKDRQYQLKKAAEKCLQKLNVSQPRTVRYKENQMSRKGIARASRKTIYRRAQVVDDWIQEFKKDSVETGDYFKYRKQAKRLLKTHNIKAISAIVDVALGEDQHIDYPKNRPLRPLFPGPIGWFVSYPKLKSSIKSISTDSAAKKHKIQLFNFSAMYIRFADRNGLDSNSSFGESFQHYVAPEDGSTDYNEDALIQIISDQREKRRRQFLKEVLISGGEVTGDIILRILVNDLIPKRNVLIQNQNNFEKDEFDKQLAKLDERIDFLLSVLPQTDSTESFNDFNKSHGKRDKFKRASQRLST